MDKYTMKSKIKEIYKHPVGKDIINKILLQVNKPRSVITNIFISNLSLSFLKNISFGKLKEDFFMKILKLLNKEKDIPLNDNRPIEKKWWKESIFYQIYPMSFKDSNDDGIGDIQGIISKLDYLKNLGIDALWLSPIYDSPNDDNGYDIRDYKAISERFGTMEDFDLLLLEIHKRDMKLIMDLVVNHTSDEHEWFKKAMENKESPYRDYYFFKKGKKNNKPPNNWVSFFSGSAWKNIDEENNEWALHLFTKKQMDLNWDNPKVREEISSMVKWWLEKGVDGFRLDVINYISKNEGLEDGSKLVGDLMEFYGIEEYFYGENLHKYLRELHKNAFAPYDAFSVGETPGIGLEMGKLLTGDYRKEMDTIFNFDHLETPGHIRSDEYKYDLNYLKKYMMEYQKSYNNHYWMSIFFNNHDNPRMVSKIDPTSIYRNEIGKLLALMQLTLKGTPFIFQGDEIGLINKKFESMDNIKDVESINRYNEFLKSGMTEKEAFKIILTGTRDHSRTPIPWSDEKHAGFSKIEPWILDDDDYKKVNVKAQLEQEDSIFNFYKKLISIRKENSTLIYGDINFIHEKKENYFAYYRTNEEGKFFIEMNLSNKIINKEVNTDKYIEILSNMNYRDNINKLKPYEVNLYKVLHVEK